MAELIKRVYRYRANKEEVATALSVRFNQTISDLIFDVGGVEFSVPSPVGDYTTSSGNMSNPGGDLVEVVFLRNDILPAYDSYNPSSSYKIELIKAIRTAADTGLKEAKDLVDRLSNREPNSGCISVRRGYVSQLAQKAQYMGYNLFVKEPVSP